MQHFPRRFVDLPTAVFFFFYDRVVSYSHNTVPPPQKKKNTPITDELKARRRKAKDFCFILHDYTLILTETY